MDPYIKKMEFLKRNLSKFVSEKDVDGIYEYINMFYLETDCPKIVLDTKEFFDDNKDNIVQVVHGSAYFKKIEEVIYKEDYLELKFKDSYVTTSFPSIAVLTHVGESCYIYYIFTERKIALEVFIKKQD